MSEEDPIDVPYQSVLCPVHMEPLRATWPMGYPTVALSLIDRVLRLESVIQETRKATGKAAGDITPAEALAVLAKKPACCRVSKETMLRVYEDSRVGSFKRCVVCSKKRLGTPYKTTLPGGADADYPHVCFHCVLHDIRAFD